MAKKLLYVCKYPLAREVSLKNKFNGQIAGFESMGFSCYYLAFDNDNYYLINNNKKTIIKKIKNGASSKYLHFNAFVDLYKCAIKAINDIGFDYMYVRSDPIDINGISMYRQAKKNNIKIITEIPSYPIYRDNVKNPIMRAVLALSDFLQGKVSRYIDLYAIIGNKCEEFRSRPAINIENGVSVELFSLKKPLADSNINIIGVASMSNWQGYDRAIKGLAKYDGNVNVHLRLVGDDGDGSLAKWKELADELGLQDKVEFIPARYGEQLDKLIDISDVGLATLALYRSKLEKASPLKVREYMSRGLPIVYSSVDSTLASADNFTIKVPEDESTLDISKVVEFAEIVKNKEEISKAMRNYAIEHMSWSNEFKKIFEKLEKYN